VQCSIATPDKTREGGKKDSDYSNCEKMVGGTKGREGRTREKPGSKNGTTYPKKRELESNFKTCVGEKKRKGPNLQQEECLGKIKGRPTQKQITGRGREKE